jgi:hypothetical protein
LSVICGMDKSRNTVQKGQLTRLMYETIYEKLFIFSHKENDVPDNLHSFLMRICPFNFLYCFQNPRHSIRIYNKNSGFIPWSHMLLMSIRLGQVAHMILSCTPVLLASRLFPLTKLIRQKFQGCYPFSNVLLTCDWLYHITNKSNLRREQGGLKIKMWFLHLSLTWHSPAWGWQSTKTPFHFETLEAGEYK